jgi:putative oxidoreductase
MNMTTMTQTWNGRGSEAARRSRGLTALLGTLQILSAAMFLFAGSHKLTGGEDMVQAFATIGLGQWFRYFTGVLEVASAIALLIPAVAAYGAAALAVTMVGAIITHLFIIGGNPAPAIVLLVFTATIAWFRGMRS